MYLGCCHTPFKIHAFSSLREIPFLNILIDKVFWIFLYIKLNIALHSLNVLRFMSLINVIQYPWRWCERGKYIIMIWNLHVFLLPCFLIYFSENITRIYNYSVFYLWEWQGEGRKKVKETFTWEWYNNKNKVFI